MTTFGGSLLVPAVVVGFLAPTDGMWWEGGCCDGCAGARRVAA